MPRVRYWRRWNDEMKINDCDVQESGIRSAEGNKRTEGPNKIGSRCNPEKATGDSIKESWDHRRLMRKVGRI
ncbi:hypothetical protein MJO28_016224 [Puccinia striiformis f. sp. tritici]|uniref:Uncharacterized protein n=1 Tax=Puccinia striiformis f. sp. tritici TaxID=168172 RepID=A0ACC0DQ32_9BASI|nr:hypothetical protein MJO28_016224 [Puccinia striiformis f. sp. tritici]